MKGMLFIIIFRFRLVKSYAIVISIFCVFVVDSCGSEHI